MKFWKGIVILLMLVLFNLLASLIICRWDMTNDKRYSISQPTKNLLESLSHPLEITILLNGELKKWLMN